MHYNSFPQFKEGLVEAGFPKNEPDARIDILFQYYKQAGAQTSVTLGRLKDTQDLRAELGTAFDGGKARLLLTPLAQGFKNKGPAPPATIAGKTVTPRGVTAGEWKEWKDGKETVITPADWNKKGVKDQMDIMLGNRWSIWLNDCFILGGIHKHALFHLVSRISDYGDAKGPFPFNVTQRELIGLITFGYAQVGPSSEGIEYKCTNTRLADAATFTAYVDQMASWTGAVQS